MQSAAPAAPRLSAVVITKNEEVVIARCIRSLSWADQVVVVDSGSTDRTVEICRSLGAEVHLADWQGPATQRNRGIALAKHEWILALDADEWVTGELQREIGDALADPGRWVAYRIPRLSSYCGRYMRHGGWWPDHVSRLFRRDSASFGGGIVHDHLVSEGPIGHFRNHLMHEPFRDMTAMLAKLNAYSTWGAQRLHEDGERAGLGRAVLHALWTFFRTYVIRAGFLDGREGFMLAVSNAEGTYYKYVKLMLIARDR